MIGPRYLAAIAWPNRGSGWMDGIAARVRGEDDLRRATTDRSVAIFANCDVQSSVDGRSIVIGAAYERLMVRDPLADLWGDAGLARYLDAHWGDFVMFVADAAGSAAKIIRSPSGGLHAFRIRTEDGCLFSSDALFALEVAGLSPKLDVDFLRHEIAFPHLLTARTGLTGVDEVLAGECLQMGEGREQRHGVWSPWKYAAAAKKTDALDEATKKVRETVSLCASRLAASHDPIILELSGGLDSSIVAAAIRQQANKIKAVNLVTPTAEGDERRYARNVARLHGIDLIEAAAEQTVDLTTPGLPRLARPGLPGVLLGWEAPFIAAAATGAAPAFFTGTGGDNVFCSLGSAAPAADALLVHGPGRTFARAVGYVATIHNSTWSAVAGLALRQAWRSPPNPKWPRVTEFSVDTALPMHPDPHPWLEEPDAALPGSRAHIRSILAAYAHLDGYARHQTASSVFPLLAQPVVELCLSIPTWRWVEGGRDRAVARAAFADALPTSIIHRRTKGMMNAFCADTYEANRERLLPFLVDGVLASAGLLDVAALRSFLASRDRSNSLAFYRVLALTDVERWARTWQ